MTFLEYRAMRLTSLCLACTDAHEFLLFLLKSAKQFFITSVPVCFWKSARRCKP